MPDASHLIHAPDGSRARVQVQGAHVLSWRTGDGRERLFLSERAVFVPGVAVRGGVPLIFPQFAQEGPLPKHGFARTLPWRLQDRGADADAESLVFMREDDAETRRVWDHAFAARYTVTLAPRALHLELEVVNHGDDPLAFTAALHSYLAVSDIEAIRIVGLAGLRYRDQVDAGRLHREQAEALRIEGEVDRIYFDTPESLRLSDTDGDLAVEQSGFVDTVIWNPGEVAAARISDLAPADHRRFICIEAATIGTPVQLAPGERWQGSQRLGLVP